MLDKDYFYFRQFKIKQSNSAFKVGFDGILLGAWIDFSESSNILDIGTGTGLLALMAAQKNPAANIVAIEPDEKSFRGWENFSNSNWSKRLHIYNHSIQEFSVTCSRTFDHIVCNPPYFNNSMLPAKNEYILTKHTITLSQNELASNTFKMLSETGRLSIILPNQEGELFIQTAFKNNLFLSKKTNIITKMKIERLLLEFRSLTSPSLVVSDLPIYDQNGKYTEDYLKMVSEFYLGI